MKRKVQKKAKKVRKSKKVGFDLHNLETEINGILEDVIKSEGWIPCDGRKVKIPSGLAEALSTPPAVTVDSLLAKVPAGWNALLRSDEEKGWFANVCMPVKEKSVSTMHGIYIRPDENSPMFQFYGKTAVIALSRAVDMAIQYQANKDNEAKEAVVPMAMVMVRASAVPEIEKLLDTKLHKAN